VSFLYHFRVLERVGARIRVRVWITNPDTLAWGAKAVPKNKKNILNTPHFVAILLHEQRSEADALCVEHTERVRKSVRAKQRQIDAGRDPGGEAGDPHRVFWDGLVRDKLASLEVDNIVGFPAPKHAWEVPKTPAAEAKYAAYWQAWNAWDGRSDPPDHLARFDLTIELNDAKWMPSQWPEGVKGTTAYARS